MTDTREIEIKLDGDPADAPALRDRLQSRLGLPGRTTTLRSVYFDTPGGALARERVTLRLRWQPGKPVVQTVKQGEGGAGGGLFRRGEWETAIEGDQPDRRAARKTPAGPILKHHAGGPLEPRFESVVERTTWVVERGGSRMEVALDNGHVAAQERTAPLLELECELQDGHPAELVHLLAELDVARYCRLGVLTKSERGEALLRSPPQRLFFKAEPVVLRPEMTGPEAFGAIMHGCLRQLRRNEPGVVEHRDPEALHQARVGLRRLRSALSLFGPLVRDGTAQALASRLRDASRVFGEARNLDVFLADTAEPEAERLPGPGDAFLSDMRARRDKAYDDLVALIRSPAWRQLLLDVFAWVETGPWLTADDPAQRALRALPVTGLAATILDRHRRRVKKKGRGLADLEPDARHRLRIAAKKLRYASDFMAALATGRKARSRHAAFTAALEGLQADLGALNDIHTGQTIALGYAEQDGSAAGGAVFAAGHASGEADARTADLLGRAVHHHARLMAVRPFWRQWRKDAAR